MYLFCILLLSFLHQISEEMLSATQNCSSSIISSQCDAILGEFAIDWPQVTWSDMRKPLYSGLALSLHTQVQLNGQALPDDVWGQADIWASAFGGKPGDFVTDVASITMSGRSEFQACVYCSLPPTISVTAALQASENCQLTEGFFVGAQRAVRL